MGDVRLRTRPASDVVQHTGKVLAAGYQPSDRGFFARASRQQVHGVHAPVLTDSVDASDALLQAHRCPRQLEIHNQAAAALQVQSLARRVGGQQQRCSASREPRCDVLTLRRCQAAVQQERGIPRECIGERAERVAVSVNTIAGWRTRRSSLLSVRTFDSSRAARLASSSN